MKSHFKFSILSLAVLTVPAISFGQASINPPSGTSGNYSSSTLENQSNKLFDVDSDMIDPGEGFMRWKGKIFTIEDSKIIRERFQRYLSNPVPEGKSSEYRALLKKIHKLLEQQSTSKAAINKQVIEGMNLLLDAAKFEVDGQQSIVLAKQVYKTFRQRAEQNDLIALQRNLEERQKNLQRQIDNREKIRRQKEESLVNIGGKGDKKHNAPSSVAPTPEHAFLIETAAENKASMKSANAQTSAITASSKLEFQSMMVSFLIARRYDHALLASAFYRTFFKGTHHGIKVAEKEFAEVLPISNFVPSLESFDQIAREMKEETRKSLKSASSLWDNSQKFHAYKQLFSSFIIGENEISLAYYPENRKKQFMELGILLRELQRQSENKDIGVIEETLKKIKAIAPDFPDSEVTGKVNAAKQASNMAILRARHAALTAAATGTPEALAAAMDSIESYIHKAAEFWPQNPAIPQFMEEVLNRANVVSQLAPEFDKLVAAGKTREIFNRRAEFTAALMQDAVRRKRFEEIISHIAALETAMAQINMLLARQDNMIAWDLILTTETLAPNDELILLTKAKIATRIPEYARTLETAAIAENQGKIAIALNKYIAAQTLNPSSEICRTAIQRLAEQLLNQKPLPIAPSIENEGAQTPKTKEQISPKNTNDPFNF